MRLPTQEPLDWVFLLYAIVAGVFVGSIMHQFEQSNSPEALPTPIPTPLQVRVQWT